MEMLSSRLMIRSRQSRVKNVLKRACPSIHASNQAYFSSESCKDDVSVLTSPRESMAYDVCIVGGGPSGLAASIRLKQLCQERQIDLSVCIVEKGSEIGSHILSGNVFEPKALDALLPHWQEEYTEARGDMSPLTPVTKDRFMVLTEGGGAYQIPNVLLPKQLHNEGNYILSLGQLCRYLGDKAEHLGVEVYPGFAASEVLYGTRGDDTTTTTTKQQPQQGVLGIATRDVGIAKDGTPKPTFERGVELHARQTLFAEGARGSCSQELISKFNLRHGVSFDGKTPIQEQTYGLGLKEVWEVPDGHACFQQGLVQHTLGWPLQSTLFDKTYGGTFLYHQAPNLLLLGMVVGLDYANPYLNPYQELQRFKTHPYIAKQLQGGTCLSYGARVLNEGGLHAIPKLTFPGGMLVGCSAGFLNVVKIKGSHAAIQSGVEAAEVVFEGLVGKTKEGVVAFASVDTVTDTTTNTTHNNDNDDTTTTKDTIYTVAQQGEINPTEPLQNLTTYQTRIQTSWIYDELHQVRNCHAAFQKWGFLPGLIYNGLVCHVLQGKEPWTLTHGSSNRSEHGLDWEKTVEVSSPQAKPIDYPPPDGVLTFDLLTNLQRSGTFHEENQPVHLRIKEGLVEIPEGVSMQTYAAPEQRFCPAGVYEYVSVEEEEGGGVGEEEDGKKKLVINAQNCIHCKCCSIKMPHEYINWTVPEGGGGPQYQIM